MSAIICRTCKQVLKTFDEAGRHICVKPKPKWNCPTYRNKYLLEPKMHIQTKRHLETIIEGKVRL